ncbi:MAG TPA: ABC transporter permease [Tepidisphaeraceae bacterium]|nr:ABC transporter permease [Tepidisphaeraceae bacterium]
MLRRVTMRLITRPITALGSLVLGTLEFTGGLGYLLRDTAASVHRSLFAPRGRRLGWMNLWAQMVRVGVRSIPIVSLVVFCIGAILALQMAPILKEYGALAMVADIIGIAMFRELGPLVAAIVLTGFAGASIAAELGTMVVSEEIEALEASAIPPIRFLVVPRVLATTVMMICLAVVADLVGMAGGMLVSRTFLGIGYLQYLQHTFTAVKLQDFLTGLIKAGVFGALISGLACYLGLGVTGGAQGVGNATTRTVVLTIVALITVDLMFTAVFYYLGL